MPTILVVEDEASIAELLRFMLEWEGYRVVTAADGREGLRLLGEAHPALVLSDVMMPHIDGRQLARAIQTDIEYRNIPVILMSAASQAIVRGVPHAAFIAKPFEFQEVLDTIARLLAGRDGAT